MILNSITALLNRMTQVIPNHSPRVINRSADLLMPLQGWPCLVNLHCQSARFPLAQLSFLLRSQLCGLQGLERASQPTVVLGMEPRAAGDTQQHSKGGFLQAAFPDGDTHGTSAVTIGVPSTRGNLKTLVSFIKRRPVDGQELFLVKDTVPILGVRTGEHIYESFFSEKEATNRPLARTVGRAPRGQHSVQPLSPEAWLAPTLLSALHQGQNHRGYRQRSEQQKQNNA
ncbi:hypothetical protein CB1_000252008 [Camelus ferus]|nr:hypothetical protein CB1_000252008 [Camelus ferus]